MRRRRWRMPVRASWMRTRGRSWPRFRASPMLLLSGAATCSRSPAASLRERTERCIACRRERRASSRICRPTRRRTILRATGRRKARTRSILRVWTEARRSLPTLRGTTCWSPMRLGGSTGSRRSRLRTASSPFRHRSRSGRTARTTSASSLGSRLRSASRGSGVSRLGPATRTAGRALHARWRSPVSRRSSTSRSDRTASSTSRSSRTQAGPPSRPVADSEARSTRATSRPVRARPWCRVSRS